jgi:DNA-binding IclR family transcriptional regulator
MRNTRDYGETSLDKAILVLFSFSRSSPQGIREIAEHTGIPVSTTYRLVRTLRRHGLVAQDSSTRQYSLGLRLLELEQPLLQQLDLWQLARPHLQALARQHTETIQLTLRSEQTAITIHVIESKEPLRFAPTPGAGVPLHCGAQAKAILAFLPAHEIHAYFRKRTLRAFTPHTLTDTGTLAEELRAIQQMGYARSRQELYLGAAGVAAPIFDRSGVVIGSCGISGPIQRLTEAHIILAATDVVLAARAISQTLGAPATG